MKKVAFILASLLVMMLAGCGGEGSSSASPSSTVDSANSDNVEVVSGVGTEESSLTTPEVPNKDAFANLSVGTPPGLPE